MVLNFGLHLLARVETSGDALGVQVSLLHGSDHGGVKTLDNLVDEVVKLLVVHDVLSDDQEQQGCARC